MENKTNLQTPASPEPSKEAESVKAKIIMTTGRRKTSVAQVQMVSSKNGGKFVINQKTVQDYFKGNERQALIATQSLNAVKGFGGYNFYVKVYGGGITGQAESIRHGVARALSQLNEKMKLQMRKEGFLTRDPRAVERKKSGQPKARKRFQYSKR